MAFKYSTSVIILIIIKCCALVFNLILLGMIIIFLSFFLCLPPFFFVTTQLSEAINLRWLDTSVSQSHLYKTSKLLRKVILYFFHNYQSQWWNWDIRRRIEYMASQCYVQYTKNNYLKTGHTYQHSLCCIFFIIPVSTLLL